MGFNRGDGGTGTSNPADVAEIVTYRDEAQAAAAAAASSSSSSSSSASAAASSASAAATSASNAATSASSAASSASAAATSASDAAASAAAAATFDPALYLTKAGNLSGLASPSTARTNLGLGTAATAASTDFATAAQGTKADSALQPAAIGSTVQAYSVNLSSYATVAPTAAGLALLDDANAAAQRTTLGLVIGTDVQAYNANTAFVNVAQNFTVPQRAATLTDNDLSFDLSAKQNFKCTPTAGGTLTFTNPADGLSGFIILVNGSNYAITAAATTKISATALARISASGTYRLDYASDGTNTYVTASESLA